MTEFEYKRKAAPYSPGKRFRLSRSKIDTFRKCQRCFYLECRNGIRPPSMPFTLNLAVDELLKKEFDMHRAKSSTHPLLKAYGLDAVPLQHRDINNWRNFFSSGISYFHEPSNFEVAGYIDDVWINPEKELIVVDYKATAKKVGPETEDDLYEYYKWQVEVYQWIFRKMGYVVNPTAYFVYANGKKDKEAFDGKLEFSVKLIPYTGSDAWIEPVLLEARNVLDRITLPASNPDCEQCDYRRKSNEAESAMAKDLNQLAISLEP